MIVTRLNIRFYTGIARDLESDEIILSVCEQKNSIVRIGLKISRMEIEIQTLDKGEAIISTIGIPFPVSTRIHKIEDYVNELNRDREHTISYGLATVF